MPSLYELKEQMCEIGRRIWMKDFVASNDGNFSYKIAEDEYLVTPTGHSKGFLQPNMMLLVNAQGEKLAGELKPSSEIKMHLEVYRQRPDIRAVIHAHPPTATGFAVAGIPLSHCVLPEVVVSLGGIPICPYGTPGTMDLAASLMPYLQKADAFLLSNHGALTLGKDLFECYYRMETMELFAKILLTAKQLGKVTYLNPQQVEELHQLRERLGVKGRHFDCSTCGACPGTQGN